MKKYLHFFLMILVIQCRVWADNIPLSKGIGIVNSCSAALITLSGISDSRRAIVATNGHCLLLNLYLNKQMAYPLPEEILYNITNQEFITQTSIKLHSPHGTILTQANKLLFATMTSTDLALFELKETYRELQSQYQIEPLEIAKVTAPISEKISIVSGYYNRQFQCSIKDIVHLIEGPFHTDDSIQLSHECDIYPGVSGSPIILRKTNQVIGLANTHSSGEGSFCGFNNPCLADILNHKFENPVSGTSFGISLHPLYSCFNKKTQEFDFLKSSCTLVKRKNIQIFKKTEFTEYELNKRIEKFQKFAQPILVQKNLILKIEKDSDWDMHLGSSGLDGKIFSIVVGSKIYETEKLTADSFDLILCHELGHLMGQTPKKKNNLNQSGNWASGEGESDYFAGSCVTQLWNQELPVQFSTEDWKIEVDSCNLYPHLFQVQLCQRAELAALNFFSVLYGQYGRFSSTEKGPPNLGNHDQTQVQQTELNYPKTTQCRLDSVLAGIFHQPRPTCWYKEGLN